MSLEYQKIGCQKEHLTARMVKDPRKRWEDQVAEDAENLIGVRTWKTVASSDRKCWKQKIINDKAQFGL